MEIQKFADFLLNEARANKKDVIDDLLEMLKKKPNIEMDKLPNERGIYSIAGMKKFLSKYSTSVVDNALHDIQNDKNIELNSIYVRIEHWNKSMPYFYMDLTETQAKKMKSDYEDEEKSKNEKEIGAKAQSKKSAAAASAAKEEAKKTASVARKSARKSSGQGAERKSGSAPKKRTVRKTK